MALWEQMKNEVEWGKIERENGKRKNLINNDPPPVASMFARENLI